MTIQDRPVLQNMEGFPFPVLFSDGDHTRARYVAERCQRAHRYLKSVLELDPTFRLWVLSPEDWAGHAVFQIYGMPHYAAEVEIFVGATTADFFQHIVGMLDDVLTRDQRAEMEAVYGVVSGQSDMSTFADLLVVHELAHLFHVQVPFAFPRLWLEELFCNLCLHAYVVEAEPTQLPTLITWPERMEAVPVQQVRHRSLEDFEKLYVDVGPENYGWYQLRLHAAARDIYNDAGVDALKRLYRTFEAHENDLTDRQLADLLGDRVHPTAARVLETWPK